MRRLLTGACAAVILAAGISGCSATGSSESAPAGTTRAPVVGQAPAAGATLTAEEFAAALEIPGTVVIDVRTPAEFAAGHLPGAVNLDVEAPGFADQVAALDPAGSYAVYCRSGNRSQVALDVMARSGVRGAYHLAGGIGAWQAAGGEIVTG